MRRTTALTPAIALAALLAGAPVAATSLEDDHTAAMIATVTSDDPTAPLVLAAPDADPSPIAPDAVVGEVAIADLTAIAPAPSLDVTSNLFRGNILYDLDAGPGDVLPVGATPLDGISDLAEDLVIGLHDVDLQDIRIAN